MPGGGAAQVEGSYLVAETLKEEGPDTLFYLMGGPNYEIADNSEDAGICAGVVELDRFEDGMTDHRRSSGPRPALTS